MEYRALGQSGLRVSVLTMGTMTFGGSGGFADVGSTDVEEAERQVDMCLEAGVPVALSSDAHRPQDVGADYDQALEMLADLGVRELCVFEGRTRRLELIRASGAGAGSGARQDAER